MIESFTEFNAEGVEILVELKYPIERKVSSKDKIAYINSPSKKGIMWVYKGKKIVIQDASVSVQGLPSVELNSVIAVYSGMSGAFPPPNNAVIYNLDGSIRKVLEMPSFISELIRKRLTFLNEPNPPLSWAKYEEGGLCFGGFAWREKSNRVVVNSISLEMERGSYEIRELNVEQGTFGECLQSGLTMYAKY